MRKIVRTAKDISAGKYGLWELIQPIWYKADIYGGRAAYESSAACLTAAQRRALAWVRYNNEVFEGGHRQFLMNDVGIVWKDALEAMEMAGAESSADRLRRIAAAFGGEIPFEKEERLRAFDELWENGVLRELLGKCDSEYTYGDRADKLTEMLAEYAKAHPAEFAVETEPERPPLGTYIKKRIIRTADEIAAGKYDMNNLLAPVYNEIYIYESKARYDSDCLRFSKAQRLANAWDIYNSEVQNGGHQQFLINSSGIVWSDALECMETVGADKAAAILRRVIKAFGGEIPYERKERLAAFDSLWERRNKTFPAMLEKCDRDYYSGGFSLKTAALIDSYIRSCPQEFALDGEFRFGI